MSTPNYKYANDVVLLSLGLVMSTFSERLQKSLIVEWSKKDGLKKAVMKSIIFIRQLKSSALRNEAAEV